MIAGMTFLCKFLEKGYGGGKAEKYAKIDPEVGIEKNRAKEDTCEEACSDSWRGYGGLPVRAAGGVDPLAGRADAPHGPDRPAGPVRAIHDAGPRYADGKRGGEPVGPGL